MTEQDNPAIPPAPNVERRLVWLCIALFAWVAAYAHLTEFADAVIAALGLTRQTHFGDAIHFFVYDTPKVLLLLAGVAYVKEIVGKVWPYIAAGIALGAGIHGYVPEDFLASIMGKDAPWWPLPAAVLIGVPMYSNAAGILIVGIVFNTTL